MSEIDAVALDAGNGADGIVLAAPLAAIMVCFMSGSLTDGHGPNEPVSVRDLPGLQCVDHLQPFLLAGAPAPTPQTCGRQVRQCTSPRELSVPVPTRSS
jgi:hypothetical protein